jgi:hypothetical protein
MSYGIIFWSASPHSINSFKFKKIITNTGKKELYRKLFSKLKTVTFQSQYIFSLLCFVCSNKEQYTLNLDIHCRNTMYGSDFNYPTSNLASYQKSTYFMGLKVSNSLPLCIKDKHDTRKFKPLIKNFLYCSTLYTLKEYFNYNKNETTL